MTSKQRAAQIWPVLALAAHNRQILTYDIVARLIGVPRPALGGFLEHIQTYCLERGLPAITCLVVSEVTGNPGPGFTAEEDVPRAQAQVFKRDWLEETPPKPEDFK